jgi:hypothetical protein
MKNYDLSVNNDGRPPPLMQRAQPGSSDKGLQVAPAFRMAHHQPVSFTQIFILSAVDLIGLRRFVKSAQGNLKADFLRINIRNTV